MINKHGACESCGANAFVLEDFGNLSLGVTIGTYLESEREVFQFNEDRFRHTLILGRTGAGKSNHVQQLEREDIRNGAGVFILAAHEDDALYPLSCVPEERLGDVVFIDASNPEYLPRMNPLDVDTDDQGAVDRAVENVLELVTMDSEYSWAGPRFETRLRNAIKLLLSDPERGAHCVNDLNKTFTDPDFDKGLLKYVTSREVYDYWTKVFPQEQKSNDSGEVNEWVLAKISRFSTDHVLGHIFGAGKSTLNMQSIVDEGKIFVAYVPESRIGAIVARTICKWLVMQLRDAIMNRRSAPGAWQGLNYCLYEGDSAYPQDGGFEPFFVYVDEFSKFATTDFEALLAEARKQHVGFVLSAQTLSQSLVYDRKRGHTTDKLQEAILGNVGSMICYPVGVRDAELLSRQFDVDVDKLKRIERYRPLARLCIDNQVGRPGTLEVGLRPKPDNPTAARRIAKNQAFSGTWVEVEGATGKGTFLRMVNGTGRRKAPKGAEESKRTPHARSRVPKTVAHGEGSSSHRRGEEDKRHALAAEEPSEAEGILDGAPEEGPTAWIKPELVDYLESEYDSCLPKSWHATLRDSLSRGFDDASDSFKYRLLMPEQLGSYADQFMRVHAALTVADFLEASQPKCPPIDDFCIFIRTAAKHWLDYAAQQGVWEGFDDILGTMPEGVFEAWTRINHPTGLRAAEEMAIHEAGESCTGLFEDS